MTEREPDSVTPFRPGYEGPTLGGRPLVVRRFKRSEGDCLRMGGALASGKVGFIDQYTLAPANTRNYDNFVAWAPGSQHVINSGKEFELSHDRALTEPTSGTNWSRRHVEGKHLTLPPAGREGLTTRIVVSIHPLDVDEFPATDVTNALRADLEVTPRVLLTGRS